MTRARCWPASVALVACSGCAAQAVSPPLPTQREWDAARAWLAELRETEPQKPFSAVVQVSLRDPHSLHVWGARGAVAVDPHRALRMISWAPVV